MNVDFHFFFLEVMRKVMTVVPYHFVWEVMAMLQSVYLYYLQLLKHYPPLPRFLFSHKA
jgi:hypothetical protein